MLRTIFYSIFLVLRTLVTVYHLLIVNILVALKMNEEAENRVAITARKWAKVLVKATGSKVEVIGAEKVPEQGAILFVSNHQSFFDIPLLMGYVPRPKGFVAKVELLKIPIVRTWMVKMHSLFLDRQNMRKSLLTMREAIEVLKAGHCLVIFPEGTRSKSNEMAEFKRGSLSIAQKANVPVVPITIVNNYKILEGNTDFRITPAKVQVYIHDPIYPADLQPGEELSSMTRAVIASKLF